MISPNFRLQEFLAHGPPEKDLPEYAKANLEKLVKNVLQPARDLSGLAIQVTSGFRTEEINRRVGGSATSDHLTGNAADVYAAASRVGSWKHNTRHLFAVMAENYMASIGQLILEDLRHEGATRFWIHVSNRTLRHTGETLYTSDGKLYVTYQPAVHAADLLEQG